MFALKELKCLSNLLWLQEAPSSGGKQQSSRSQGVQAAPYGDLASATFIDEKDCRLWCFSRDQNGLGLSGSDVSRLLKLDPCTRRDSARRNPTTILDFRAWARLAGPCDFVEDCSRDYDLVEELREQTQVAGFGQRDEWAGSDNQPHTGLRSFVCLSIRRSVASSVSAPCASPGA